MKIDYYPDIDQMSISFCDKKSSRTREIAPGVVVDWDAKGNIVAIDIEHASKKVDVKKLLLNNQPVVPLNLASAKDPFHAKIAA
jgi:uncharacterized protein YuzE